MTAADLLRGLGPDTFETPAVLNRPETRNPYARAPPAVSPDTNAAIASITNADNDAEMEDSDRIETIVGGKEVVTQMLLTLVQDGIHAPIEAFRRAKRAEEEAKRIKKATTGPGLTEQAARIAAAVQAEQAAERPIVRSIVSRPFLNKLNPYANSPWTICSRVSFVK